jgi:hypothetical protein
MLAKQMPGVLTINLSHFLPSMSKWNKVERRQYPIGKKVTEKQMRELNIERHAFRGE